MSLQLRDRARVPDQHLVYVHLLPTLIPTGALRGGVAVVVDVLRATSVMVEALARGCRAVIPCLEIDEARREAARHPEGSALLAGERQGLPIEGFDFGNSPGSFTPEVCAGKTLVMTTTNGTRAILASLDADRVLVASFGNLGATIAEVARDGRLPHVVCSGTDGEVSWEDTLLAGALVVGLAARSDGPPRRGNDPAEIAASLWRGSAPAPIDPTALAALLERGRGGRRVRELGLAPDILAAARLDGCARVAELKRDPTRIVMNP